MTRDARGFLIAFVVCMVLVALCIAFVDRPVAEYVDAHVVGTALGGWIEAVLRPLEGLALIALLGLLADGVRAMRRVPARPALRTLVLCCWATIWAVAAEIILKRVFGRGWPDPTWIRVHQYGFHWLRGGQDWESFPSGTVTVAAAIVAVVWSREPRWRPRRRIQIAGSLAVVLAAAAVVAVNYHWVGDVVAGAYLGALIGYLTVALLEEADVAVQATGARRRADKA